MIFIIACLVIFSYYQVDSEETFRYEKLHNFGLGRRVIPNYHYMDKYGYPDQSFTKKRALYVRSPYRNVYQGVWRKGDRRVYSEKFTHKAEPSGFRMFSHAVLDCTITHLAVETVENVPIIYRGGAGYRYFMVIVKADPWVKITARVKAYCKNVTMNDGS